MYREWKIQKPAVNSEGAKYFHSNDQFEEKKQAVGIGDLLKPIFKRWKKMLKKDV